MSSREVCFRLLGFHKTLCLSKQNRVDWGGEGQHSAEEATRRGEPKSFA